MMLLRNYFCIFVWLYLQVVNITCEEGSSLAFAIDDTLSMRDDIYYVRKGAKAIMNLVFSKKSSIIKDLVLVTFNDPKVDLRTTTNSQSVFLDHLNNITTHNWDNTDCEEMSLTGMETALESSRPESYIYVFTDANAKDYYKLNKIKKLCQKKQSQVVIVYTIAHYCYRTHERMFTVYYDVAKACSGQIFVVEKDQIDSILKTIEILLQGKTSIFKWKMVPRTASYVPVNFTLDEKAEYAIISSSGINVDLRITNSNSLQSWNDVPRFEKTMWTNNAKVVKLIQPKPGTYYAWVKGDSVISIVVYGRTDFSFEHGFSVLRPKSLTDTAKQPIAGLKQHLSVNVTDPDDSVNIHTVQILDIKNNDHIIDELPLRNIGKDFYITEAFVSPKHTFRIAVKGEIKKTHETIIRNSRTNIDPYIVVDPIPVSKPDIKIDEGLNFDVKYGSEVTLTCKVTAHPPPKIQWYTSSGNLLPSESSVIEDPLFVSYLKLKNIKQSDTYICKASNKKGPGIDGKIQVSVRPIFTITGEAVYNAKYGEDASIPCNIKSYLPIKIKWFQSGKPLGDITGRHTISSDGSVLTLKSMDIGMQGKYTCEATLNTDPTIKQTHVRDVKIAGLVRPKITFATTVLKEKHFTAICRVEGVPKPIISWQFKPKGSEVFIRISGSGEEMHIPEIHLKDTGVYKCMAKNVLGEIERDFDVVVEERPIITNSEDVVYGVEGDLVTKIPCNVTGFPEPIIVWKKGGIVLKMDSKYKIQGTTLYITKPIQSDSAEYTCEANNKLGVATKTFVVEIVDNFEGDENFNGDSRNVYAEQGKPKTIKCNVEHIIGEGSVRWYKDGMLTKQTGSIYTIEKASLPDEGNYTCRVNTDEGSKSETYVVYVGYVPIFQDNSPSPITIDWQDGGQMLDCAADSQPSAKYEWVHNGKTLGAENDLQQISIIDWGQYTCQVSNVHGSISRTFEVTTSGCYITKNKATENQPLITANDTTLLPSSIGNTDILLEEDQEIKLSCPNNKNIVNNLKIMPDKKHIIAKCNTQDKFTVDEKTYRYSDLQCNNKVEASVLTTGEQCSGPNAEMIRVGFQMNGFLEAYKVCYSRSLNVPLYASTSTSTYISRNGDGVDSNKFDWSPVPELSNRKTGNWKPEGSCKCCYTKGQLVGVKELPFGPVQVASFKDNLNSIPIWNPSCAGSERTSWETFYNVIREISLHEKWSTWTGASEYVSNEGGLIPRYLWKAISGDAGSTVMVYVNDKSPVDSDVRCSSPCESVMEADKFLYCCTLDEFSKKFGVPLDTFKAV